MREKIDQAFKEHKQILDSFFASGGYAQIESAARMVIECISQGRTIYICGNGGSAADAQHIAGELIGRFRRERMALPAVALTTDTSVITSVANDYDFENIFVRQVEGLVRQGDLLWAISTSGNSANVVRAVEKAGQLGAKVLGFAGKNGSQLEKLSDVCLCTGAENAYGSQQIHQIGYHLICELVEEHFAQNKD